MLSTEAIQSEITSLNAAILESNDQISTVLPSKLLYIYYEIARIEVSRQSNIGRQSPQNHDADAAQESKESFFFSAALENIQRKKSETESKIRDYEAFNRHNKESIKELAALIELPQDERVDKWYSHLLKAKHTASSIAEYRNLAKQFCDISGYKDAKTLATDCENAALEIQYSDLMKAKNKAYQYESIDNLKRIAQQFRNMPEYKNTKSLAEKCEQKCNEIKIRLTSEKFEKKLLIKKTAYENAVEALRQIKLNQWKNADDLLWSIKSCMDLSDQFEKLGWYEDSFDWILACDEHIRILQNEYAKEKREENLRNLADKTRKKRIVAGTLLQLCTVVFYLHMLWSTRIIYYAEANIFRQALPLAVFAFAIGVINIVYQKNGQCKRAVFLIIIMLIAHITAVILWYRIPGGWDWSASMSIILLYSIAAVIPSLLLVYNKNRINKRKNATIICICVVTSLSLIAGGLVVYSNTQAHTIPRPLTPEERLAHKAKPSKTMIRLNNKAVFFDTYSIDGVSYFSIHDVALMLNGTEKQFDVNRDDAENEIHLSTDMKYTPADATPIKIDMEQNKVPIEITPNMLINKLSVRTMSLYSIDDNRYIDIFELGKALNFYVEFNKQNTIEVYTNFAYGAIAKYTEAKILFNGEYVDINAYSIGDIYYFSLHDAALLLSSTEKRFDVSWDDRKRVMALTSGVGYANSETEPTRIDSVENKVPRPLKSSPNIGEDKVYTFAMYLIGNDSYINLFELGEALDFYVENNRQGNIEVNTAYEYGAIAEYVKVNLSVNGQVVAFNAYLLNDTYYFLLHDVALLINNTEKHFEANWDNDNGAIHLSSGEWYTVSGIRVANIDATKNKVPVLIPSVLIDEVRVANLTSYMIDDNIYINLVELGKTLDFYVRADNEGSITAYTNLSFNSELNM